MKPHTVVPSAEPKKRKWLQWLKRIYGVLLAAGGGWLVVSRYRLHPTGYPSTLDIMAFGVVLLLLVAPLFDEIKFGDFAVKRAVDQAKAEIGKEITSLRTEIQTIRLGAQATSQIFLGAPPSATDLSATRPAVEAALAAQQATGTIDSLSDIPDYVPQLAKIRFAIERQVRRISRRWLFNVEDQRPSVPLWVILRDLEAEGAIRSPIKQAARDVYNICSVALHGGDLSEQQIAFARDVGPGVVTALGRVES